jgi:hypothetical protein
MTVDETLLDGLLTAGIIQFGHFVDGVVAEPTPLRLQFELLPSYPALLDLAASAIARQLEGSSLHRLVSDQDSLPLAVCVSQKTGIPLIFNQETGLSGAYDVGHPAALIANAYAPRLAESLKVVNTRAVRTGLEVISEVYLIGLSEPESSTALCLISVDRDLLDGWVAQRWITSTQRETIEEWLQRQAFTRHPS